MMRGFEVSPASKRKKNKAVSSNSGTALKYKSCNTTPPPVQTMRLGIQIQICMQTFNHKILFCLFILIYLRGIVSLDLIPDRLTE
jgi:hypothetical protein